MKGGYKAVALLHDNSSYAKGLAEETRAILDKDGQVAFAIVDDGVARVLERWF